LASEWKKKRDIMLRYDITADIYDSWYKQEQIAKYAAAIQSLAKKSFGVVLDVGCGTGLLFDYIAEKAQSIVGLDISKKTLLKARELAKHSSNIHLIYADADSMPLETSIFNHTFAMTVIQNSPNPAQTLNEIVRVSKDNAPIVVTGLKRIFSREGFESVLLKAGLYVTVLKEEEGLRCYVAICRKINH
jgi:ubiquinone/menaquinone biosynthesis C-methylase UbiE